MLIPSPILLLVGYCSSLSRRVNANSQLFNHGINIIDKLIKKGEC